MDLHSTVLAPTHERLGASMIPFAGWNMPVRYSSDLAEHKAVREAAGLFDLSHMGQIEVSGPAAGTSLDRSLVGLASAIAVGRAKYSLIADEAGRILDDLIVYRLAEEEFLVVANGANRVRVVGALTDRSTPGECSVVDHTFSRAMIAIQGPRAEKILAELTAFPLADLRYYAAARADVAGVPSLVARTGYTGEDGFELMVAAHAAEALWAELLAVGADAGLQPCGLASRDTLRLEAGMPLYGHELSEEITPFEAGLGRVVRLDHEFVGRDALAAQASTQPSRMLVGLAGEGRRAARAGSSVLAGETEVGVVTSGVLSPTLGHPIALALVAPTYASEGTALAADVRGTALPMTVVPTPFYSRPR